MTKIMNLLQRVYCVMMGGHYTVLVGKDYRDKHLECITCPYKTKGFNL